MFFAVLSLLYASGAAQLEQVTFGQVGEIEPNISPNGHWLAFQSFVKNKPGAVQIWILDISQGFESARRLAGQFDYAGEMSWSPDGAYIDFIAKKKIGDRITDQIYKVNAETNATFQVTNFPAGTVIGDSTTWSPIQGLIFFEKSGIVYSIPESGGLEEVLLDARTALSNQRPSYIRVSPDGKLLLFSVENTEKNESAIWIANLQSKSVRQLTRLHFDLFPSWIDDKHVLFTRQTKNQLSEIEMFSFQSGRLQTITHGHVDVTPSAYDGDHFLYFSRKDMPSDYGEIGDFFAGFHIWRTRMSRLTN